MMTRTCTTIVLLSATLAPAVSAQDIAVPPLAFGVMRQAPEAAVFIGPPDGGIGVVAVEPFDAGRPVTGAPYSAVAVTEVTQTLADGNRIEHRTASTVYRDSEGRVRREQPSMPLGGLMAQSGTPIVTISDPVSGTHLMLDPERKAAFRNKAAMADTFERAVSVAAPAGAAGGRVGGGAFKAAPAALDVRTERLGEQQVEGVRAEGTRTTMTIPAGAIGNQQPIDVVSERWYSQELQVVVMTRRADPRFGETVYRLTEIVRAEPSAELFQVPPEFVIEDPAKGPGIRVR